MDAQTLGLLAGIAAAIKGLAIAAPGLFESIRAILQSLHQKSVARNLKALHNIYVSMERAEDAGSTRTIIFGAHNGGGKPRPGSPFYTSALHWHVPDSKFERASTYQNVSVDAAYVNMLLEIQRTGSLRFDVGTMERGLLQRYYEAEGVCDAVIVFLTTRDNTMFYMSFCRFEGEFTDNQITDLNLIAHSIATEIKST